MIFVPTRTSWPSSVSTTSRPGSSIGRLWTSASMVPSLTCKKSTENNKDHSLHSINLDRNINPHNPFIGSNGSHTRTAGESFVNVCHCCNFFFPSDHCRLHLSHQANYFCPGCSFFVPFVCQFLPAHHSGLHRLPRLVCAQGVAAFVAHGDRRHEDERESSKCRLSQTPRQ